jgi:phage tail-like protein
MAESAAHQRTTYPLASYNFRVTVGEAAMSFTEVSGLAREFQTLTYRHGLSAWEGESIVKFYVEKYVPITLKKGVMAGTASVVAWLESFDQKPVSVSLCDETGAAVVTWHIKKAVVVKLEMPALVASSNEAAIETLTLMAAGITLEHN